MGEELESVGDLREDSQQSASAKARATAVWGQTEEGKRGGKGLLSRMRGDRAEAPSEGVKARHIDNDLDNIPTIPDLEEVREEDFASQVAEAPNVSLTRVTAFKQLEQELQHHSALHLLDGEMDLKLLTAVLSPETETREPDCEWRWDGLFAEVSAEISAESAAESAAVVDGNGEGK